MNDGLAKTSKETTKAPTMYREIEQEENVARGCVEIIEIIGYKATKVLRRYPPDKDQATGDVMKDKEGNKLYVEEPQGPFYCQQPDQSMTFAENNPNLRTETFTIQIRKATALAYLNDPENMKQFKEAN
jgi:hypothetical protein